MMSDEYSAEGGAGECAEYDDVSREIVLYLNGECRYFYVGESKSTKFSDPTPCVWLLWDSGPIAISSLVTMLRNCC
jgi:hypothetical protein